MGREVDVVDDVDVDVVSGIVEGDVVAADVVPTVDSTTIRFAAPSSLDPVLVQHRHQRADEGQRRRDQGCPTWVEPSERPPHSARCLGRWFDGNLNRFLGVVFRHPIRAWFLRPARTSTSLVSNGSASRSCSRPSCAHSRRPHSEERGLVLCFVVR